MVVVLAISLRTTLWLGGSSRALEARKLNSR